ncbi:hypothetical protein C922_05404 [Plasmodium inui San Antonio 1]|uniref:Uncharacterized protein n=1 Tax=Plasmodium inui San Antonio 1 TaxID=1237626 RepID=W7A535_9APIC|nr:hypothetical protein C922_05404 [Plasmodium inui San Antonio 1]EUD64214.1 hypothetical protein C922_05404 [Plasmodium inui San Antonio 1]
MKELGVKKHKIKNLYFLILSGIYPQNGNPFDRIWEFLPSLPYKESIWIFSMLIGRDAKTEYPVDL